MQKQIFILILFRCWRKDWT